MPTSTMRGEVLTPNPNECNSMSTNGTRGIYPYLYIYSSGNGRWERVKTYVYIPISDKPDIFSMLSSTHNSLHPQRFGDWACAMVIFSHAK